MSRYYSQLERERIITLHNQGYGCTTIAKEVGLIKQSVLLWINSYLKRGSLGLEPLHSVKTTPEFRLRVVRYLINNALSLEQTALKYNVSRAPSLNGFHDSIGVGSCLLSQNTLGRKTNTMGRPLKREPQTELEKLQYENELLRTENALLKKSESLSRTKTNPTTKFWVEAIEGLRLKGFTLELLLKCE